MLNTYFKSLEDTQSGDKTSLALAIEKLNYNDDGLIPVIAQQYDSREVLMMAWMNQQAIIETLKTRHVCYWSRSRQSFWRKGESSGNIQTLKELRIDCDGDTLLCLVDQKGPACHTDRTNCFYLLAQDDELTVISDPVSSTTN